jgi:hypothetical protein
MIIAFIGNDGSGKTTIAWQIHKFFTDLGFETIYKHEHEYVILRFLLKLLRREKRELKQLKSQGNIGREKLEDIANSLGIDYTNKNDDELKAAIELEFNKSIEKSQNKIRYQKKRSVSYTLWPILVWFDILMQLVYYRIFKRRSVILPYKYPYEQYPSFKYVGILAKFFEWLYLHSPKLEIFFEFQDLVRFFEGAKLFNIEACKVLNSQSNSFVIATHLFEIGYLTLDEFLFLKRNFDSEYLYMSFPHKPQSLDEFFIKLEFMVKNQPAQYPIFFFLVTFARCCLKLFHSHGSYSEITCNHADLR